MINVDQHADASHEQQKHKAGSVVIYILKELQPSCVDGVEVGGGHKHIILFVILLFIQLFS